LDPQNVEPKPEAAMVGFSALENGPDPDVYFSNPHGDTCQCFSFSSLSALTRDDLENFKAQHFPSTSKQSELSDPFLQDDAPKLSSQPYISDLSKNPHLSDPNHELGQNGEVGEEDDELGYYPDGVKRTLTDEQIKMFRDSEVYSIRRRRQVAMENAMSDRNHGPNNEGDDEDGEVEEEIASDYDNGTEDIKGLEQASPTDGHVYAVNEGTHKRRRLDSSNSRTELYSKVPGNTRTARGQVRELDDVVDNVGALDYGDETVGPPATNIEEKKEMHDTVDRSMNPNENIRKQGRKIWWPTIG
ncbi:MAG: hypothetical protein Q9183_006533, partial [Haloplaca sp. 2 TL-2023]